ncbi:chitobiosyldiphosphodolichol beta-mannosyltransferase [Aricia agestis]|uniref:chitobiosyldiphosphodolichol beta-mannosyltransferase n=1 Tax=Aricia agestis TaxID=91739 RepID=UPI001C205278|nr:chitobiosyldiphosphodolichol beta-mannosyltransferase [Aricia agestis]XP_041986877.1 chitobiosyldiphosphodolichol beta-mannosyltransferase [Aricia agestis]
MAEVGNKKTVKIVVLGDIGRSPRMQYHALSLASSGLNVKLIGYLETAPLQEIQENPYIVITKLNPLKLDSGPKLVQYFVKALWQAISLFLTLLITGNCEYLLCQNPPAIPTLPVCRFYCLVTKTRFVIDWHNYAYSIMAITLSPSHPLVKISKWIERFFGQSSQSNLCVTYAMKQDLIENWDISATVLYDRPPKIFHPINIHEKHVWFLKIGEQYTEFKGDQNSRTAFTELIGNMVNLRSDRPGLLFSSTSWTPDEDFGILMNALQVYDTTYSLTKRLPKLVCVITGKGPMKDHYIKKMAARDWQHVQVVTPWLKACDYPTMVASADLGVCLHTSSSGLDLPMKVVDMFGAGLPVFACHFKCIEELVSNGKNGYTFKSSDELAKQIITWFEDFPNNTHMNKLSETMRKNLEKFQETRWEDNWNLRAKKFFEN